MRKLKTFLTLFMCATLMLGISANVLMGDWNPGDSFKMHFPQKPNPNGWDVSWTSQQDAVPITLADDWMCTETGTVSDIHFWLSWHHDMEGPIESVKVQIYSDNPAGPGGFSQPDQLLWQHTFPEGSFVYRPYGEGDQGWYYPQPPQWTRPDHHMFYQINITNIPDPLIQEKDRIYWLAIQLQTANNQGQEAGWKTTLDQWNDAAVYHTPGGPWERLSESDGRNLDLAFVITGQPVDMDFGDAPDNATSMGYPTLLANNGARHIINKSVYLGATIDAETDGQPDPQAMGDDNNNIDDEDGVVFTSPLITGQMATVDVTASVAGSLFAWVDFNTNGSWSDAGEQIFSGMALTAGVNHLIFNVPANAIVGNTFARFRFTTAVGATLNYDGPAPDGEVEDYQITIKERPYKWKQLPDLTPTGVDVQTMEPLILADDFSCTKRGLITEITVWGSWLDDHIPYQEWAEGAAFTLSLHEDVPDPNVNDPTTYSHPGKIIWVKHYEPGTYIARIEKSNIDEGFWNPEDESSYIFPGDHVCWKYTFPVPATEAFCQKGSPDKPVVYWLDVQAHPLPDDPAATFGWKTSSRHWNDNAVWTLGLEPNAYERWHKLSYPTQHPMAGKPVDLAFAIYSEEPCPRPGADLGDAPDSTNSWLNTPMDAYPPIMSWPDPAIIRSARYPTVYRLGSPPYGPIHWQPKAVAWLGKGVSLENEADIQPDEDGVNNIDPIANKANQDKYDDGVLGMPLILPNCTATTFDYVVNVVDPNVDLYVNVWFDWTRDGDWDDWPLCMYTSSTPTSPITTQEWAVRNQYLPAGTLNIGANTITSLPFKPWPPAMKNDQPIWMRITLAEKPIAAPAAGANGIMTGTEGSGPPEGYDYGETEDYYFVPRQPCSGCADLNCDGVVDLTDFVIFASQWLNTCP